MNSWTLDPSSISVGTRTYRRPLGNTEIGFHWDAAFNGTADSATRLHIRSLSLHDKDIFARDNFVRAWISLKKRFPLLVARIESSDSGANFVVLERRTEALMDPDELTFGEVSSEEETEKFANDLMNGARPLSEELLARVYVLRRTDCTDQYHIIFLVAHCITDGAANHCLARTFLDTLSRSEDLDFDPLEERLAMVPSAEELQPNQRMTSAKRRWRLAIGHAISTVRTAKIQGGHALPRKFTTATHRTPAHSRVLATSFSQELSLAVLATCRAENITFGNALLVLSQVAMTRILYRRYLRGDISDEEWEYRKIQPMHYGGPMNLRPFLDSNWYGQGGGAEVFLAITFFFYTLPCMALGMFSRTRPTRRDLSNGAPHFSSLLSYPRFIHRSRLVKQQAKKFLSNPCFVEVAMAAHEARNERTRVGALEWASKTLVPSHSEEIAPMNMQGPVFSSGGSSMGNVDAISPLVYPLPVSHSLSLRSDVVNSSRAGKRPQHGNQRHQQLAPRLSLESSTTHLHCRPSELYLGAATSRQQLHISVFWDENVYDQSTIDEWLDEVKEGVYWYLARPKQIEAANIARL
ncbi:hypothetical protein CONPUDRAFT_134954, partial [Coniophora puteana RWD-64-598 SS2]